MELSIKNHIIENFKDDNEESIKEAITSSINEKDEELLPGLGVFMQLIWENINETKKDELARILKKAIKEAKNFS